MPFPGFPAAAGGDPTWRVAALVAGSLRLNRTCTSAWNGTLMVHFLGSSRGYLNLSPWGGSSCATAVLGEAMHRKGQDLEEPRVHHSQEARRLSPLGGHISGLSE